MRSVHNRSGLRKALRPRTDIRRVSLRAFVSIATNHTARVRSHTTTVHFLINLRYMHYENRILTYIFKRYKVDELLIDIK